MTTRIGILGGTFDPIHFGHLAIAEEARSTLQLDRVLFIPAAHQPLKPAGHLATAQQRVEMARLACSTNPAFELSTIELNRPGPSYTATTLEALHSAELGDLYFILGADTLADLARWFAAQRIIQLAKLVGMSRPGYTPDLAALEQQLPGLQQQLILIDGPHLEISSSDLRRRVATGRPIRYQTPDPVAEYIAATGLYRAGAP